MVAGFLVFCLRSKLLYDFLALSLAFEQMLKVEMGMRQD
jgi:hypothetical protein